MSNPQYQNDRFSLKNFQDRRLAIQTKSAKAIEAPRKASSTPLVQQLIVLGLDVTGSNNTLSTIALNSIVNIHKNNKNPSDYIKVNSMWSFDQRFAVLWVAPDISPIIPTKLEIIAVLTKFAPKVLELIPLGYQTNYCYIPRPTKPNMTVYLLYCTYFSKFYFDQFLQMKNKVRIPPQLPNMLNKLRINLSKEIKEPPPEIINQTIQLSSCYIPEIVEFFLAEDKEGSTCVKAMMNFVSLAKPHVSSPAFPWTQMVKPDGNSWGQLRQDNDPLMFAILSVIERLFRKLNGAIGTTEEKRAAMSRQAAFEEGEKLYDKLYLAVYKQFVLDKILMNPNTTETSVNYLCPHIIFTQSAGNTKPVDEEEIKDGKPDRSIFQSPAVLRLMMMYLSHMISESWKHPSKMTNFGWQNGGTEKLLNNLFKQLGFNDGDFVNHFDFIERQPHYQVSDFSFPKACFVYPDVKGQDNHFHNKAKAIVYKVLDRDLVSQLPKKYQNIFSAMLGFYSACENKSIVMTTNNVIFTPKHLNISGGALTAIHSFNHSAMLRQELINYKDWPCRVKIAHVANGDDVVIMLWALDDDIFLGYHGLMDKFRKDKNRHTTIQANEIVQRNRDLMQFGIKGRGGISGFAKMITDKYSIEFKPETLEVHPSASTGEYLSAQLYYMEEDVFGIPAFVAARPLRKILYSGLWGTTTATAGISENMIAAMRLFAAYYDSVIIYEDQYASQLSRIYNNLKRRETGKLMPSFKYFESDYFDLPEGKSVLPDLPLMSEIFTWMTGFESLVTSDEHTVEGEEYESFDEGSLANPESKKVISTPEFVHYDDYPDFEEGNQSKEMAISTTATSSTTDVSLKTESATKTISINPTEDIHQLSSMHFNHVQLIEMGPSVQFLFHDQKKQKVFLQNRWIGMTTNKARDLYRETIERSSNDV